MALPDSYKMVPGTPIVAADTTDHSPAANSNIGTRTDQIDCTNLAAGAARQSDKIDFGSSYDVEYVLAAAIEWETSPEVAAGETVDFYIGWSNNATAGTGNPGGLGGADAAYTGYSGGSLDDSLPALHYLGTMVQDNVINTDDPQVNTAIATFTPRARYGTLVVHNNAASAAFHSDMVETSFAFTPITMRVED